MRIRQLDGEALAAFLVDGGGGGGGMQWVEEIIKVWLARRRSSR